MFGDFGAADKKVKVIVKGKKMKAGRKIWLGMLLVVCATVLFGCKQKADETKAISDVKTEAEQMSTGKLRKMAMAYKDAMKDEVQKLADKIKDIKFTEMMGPEAKGLKADIDSLTKSSLALKDRFGIYYDKLKEKGGDLSGLEI